ncbi:zinc dependent phospholipase C family protein [Candidatus Saccharibacteria bacterium]|nr:zinc dependent phospholipase C family protein [Candidatus Saccharibacteria bacterium]
MPGITIHLASANQYLKKHLEENREEFIRGTIAPDIAKDYNASHYSKPCNRDSLEEYLKAKVDIYEAFLDLDLSKAFNRGQILHLIMDFEFYNNYFDEDEIRDLSLEEFRSIMYHDYASLNRHVKEKYGVEFPEEVKDFDIDDGESSIMLEPTEVDEFIERIGDIEIGEHEGTRGR